MTKSASRVGLQAVATLLMAALVLLISAQAQSPASPTTGSATCTIGVVQQLSSCVSYVTNTASQPSAACCASLQAVDLGCMCQVLNGPSIPTLDRNRALALPQACNLPTTAACTLGN